MTATMNKNACTAVDLAREYYNSSDADMFYFCIWGGEDIHIGLYGEGDTIAAASKKTVEAMAAKLQLGPESRVLDLGAGFGGAARHLAKTFGCHVTALNLSDCQNARDREMNEQQGLADKVTVVDGSYEDIPEADATFDVVWSQDAILHSSKRATVVAEAARVLKPGGDFIFTDPMMTDDCPAGVLQPILDRIHLADLGSPAFYRKEAAARGLTEVGYEDFTGHMSTHYQRVLDEMVARRGELESCVSAEYIDKMSVGLNHWVTGAENDHLTWGIFHFRKA